MKQYIVDAFTDTLFTGNPAAVFVTNNPVPEELMPKFAMENNLSETAFAHPEKDGYHLRWFTPNGEIDLCGHATLATAYVILRFFTPDKTHVTFYTNGGTIQVEKKDNRYEMAFPVFPLKEVPVTDAMEEALGIRPKEAYLGRDLLLVYENEEEIRSLDPDWKAVEALDGLLLNATAKGTKTDCVSRSFGPSLGVNEDPVCGSGHCHIFPYWAKVLDKTELVGFQASKRGGTLYGRMDGDTVYLSGSAILFAEVNLSMTMLL